MNNDTCVYQHIRLDTNEIFYIGIGNIKRPYIKINRSKWWKNITKKTDYKIEILYENLSWTNACNIEKELIQYYGRKDNNTGILVNMTDGGEGSCGLIISEENKLKMSAFAKNRRWSKEERLKLSKAHIGYKHTDEQKQKISKALKGIKRSEETRNKMSKAQSLKKGLDRSHSSILLDINTGVYYYSCTEYSELYNIPKTTLINHIKNNKISVIKT